MVRADIVAYNHVSLLWSGHVQLIGVIFPSPTPLSMVEIMENNSELGITYSIYVILRGSSLPLPTSKTVMKYTFSFQLNKTIVGRALKMNYCRYIFIAQEGSYSASKIKYTLSGPVEEWSRWPAISPFRVRFPDRALVGLAARAVYVRAVSLFPHVSLLCVPPLSPLSYLFTIKDKLPQKITKLL